MLLMRRNFFLLVYLFLHFPNGIRGGNVDCYGGTGTVSGLHEDLHGSLRSVLFVPYGTSISVELAAPVPRYALGYCQPRSTATRQAILAL